MRGLIVAALAILAVPSVAAHAVYLDSSPAKGERLAEAPSEVWVLLTEPVDAKTYSFEVVSSTGQTVSTGKPSLDPSPQARLSIALQADIPEGAYLAKWQVLSTADGHVTSGSTGFAVGNAAPPQEEGGETTQASLAAPWVRLASFLGMAIAAGAILFRFLSRAETWIDVALPKALLVGSLLNATGVAGLLLDTVRVSGLAFGAVAQTSVGMVLITRLVASLLLVALAAVAVGVKHISTRSTWWTIALLGLAAACSARLGHASLAGASAILVDWMHLATVLAWLGGVLVFLVLLFRANRDDVAADAVRRLGIRFSPIAAACVAILIITGLATTWTITKAYIPDLELFRSAWGRFLAIKVGLLGIMLAIAALNRRLLLGDRFWSQPDVDAAPPRQHLRRLVQVEAIFGVGTLFLAALLTSISPPATASAPTSGADVPEQFEVHGESYMMLAQWTARPASGSSTVLEFRLMNHHGDPVQNNTCGRDSCILLQLRPEGSSELQVYDVASEGGGRWATEDILWVNSGRYNATLQVQTADVYLDELTFTVDVA